MSDNNILNI